jgi:hypothetical protein
MKTIMAELTLRVSCCDATAISTWTARLWSVLVNGPELLEHAADLVNRRRREYGEPVDLFEHIAKALVAHAGHQGEPGTGRALLD